jgi:hypothetical protein
MNGRVQAMIIIMVHVTVSFVILPLVTFFCERDVRTNVLRPNVCRRIILIAILKLMTLETVFN